MAENNTASTADGDIDHGTDMTRLEEARRDYRERRTTVDPDEPLAGRGPTAIPGEFHGLFTAVPGRWDVSSSGEEPGTCHAAPRTAEPTVTEPTPSA